MYHDCSIVIVDDMRFSRALVAQTLQRAHYRNLRSAADGRQALELIQAEPPDVLIADWEMPGLTGIELTRAIRALEEKSRHYTAIILLTGRTEERALEEAFQAGVDDFLTKPYKAHELLARLHAASRIARLQNELLQQREQLQRRQIRQQQLIGRDPLTGLYNRRQLRAHLSAILAQAATRGGHCCLALLDIDGLGLINDNHGHRTGDEVLVRFAHRLRQLVRPMDFTARHWGGVFSLVLHSHQRPVARGQAMAILHRLQQNIAARPLETRSGPLRVTCSIGAQCITGSGDGLTAGELELMALSRLGEAKQRAPRGLQVALRETAPPAPPTAPSDGPEPTPLPVDAPLPRIGGD